LPAPPNTALQRSGWIEAILQSRCGNQDFSMYQRDPSSRPLNARPFGGIGSLCVWREKQTALPDHSEQFSACLRIE
jgi:hypothetical protein